MAGNRRRHQFAVKGTGEHAGSKRKRKQRGWLPWIIASAFAATLVFSTLWAPSIEERTGDDTSLPGSANVIPQREQASAVPSSGTSDDAEHDGVIAACTEVLERYEATPGSSLVYAGYLDLFGNVWACLVAGPGWAELCVVRAGEGGMAQTSVARIDNSLLHDLGGDAL